MLPVHRVIGHKEYGNTPPGGSPGRKSDPQYSMDWRRSRVAAFKPRTGAVTPVPEEDDDMAVFIADERGAWWLYDGFTRRYVRPGEPQVLEDLGLVKDANKVRRIAPGFFNSIPRSDVDLIDEAEIARLVAEALKAAPATPAG